MNAHKSDSVQCSKHFRHSTIPTRRYKLKVESPNIPAPTGKKFDTAFDLVGVNKRLSKFEF
jgi:hypothetical protein